MSGSYNTGTYALNGVLTPITASVNPNQTVTFNIGGLLQTFNLTANAGATMTVNQTVALADTLNLTAGGGTVILGTGIGALDSVNMTIQSGGDFVAGGTLLSLLSGGTVTYGTGGGTMTLGTASTFLSISSAPVYNGFTSSADVIDDLSLQFTSFTSYVITGAGAGSQTITISDGSGDFTFTTNAANLTDGTYTTTSAGPLQLSADASGGTKISVCFLRGTRIATPDGETEVERLLPGDLVATRQDGATVFKPVVWVGRRSIDVGRRASPDLYPVRIRAHAFAPGAPHRDLLVTQEHCVFADGGLIPARMLVNGGSVLIDASVTRFEYFHVELERHAILLANGLESESYLDTGNRDNFANVIAPRMTPDFSIRAAHKSWENDAAAPLTVAREKVEPVWTRLAERARALGYTAGATDAMVTDDPDIRLLVDGRAEIRPSFADGKAYGFLVPGGTRSLRLVSRSFRPSETIGPFVDDRRDLGVMVGSVGVGIGGRRVAVPALSYSDSLRGWHASEPGASSRWTDGDAELPLDLSAWDDMAVFVDVEIAHAGPYWMDRTPAALAA